MTRELIKLSITWAFLMAVAGGEFLLSGRQIGMTNRPVLLVFAAVMVFTIGMIFMRLPTAPTIAIGFAVMAMFWLVILFGLGAMDALTRSWYPVAHYNVP